jgi:hypothetical protein
MEPPSKIQPQKGAVPLFDPCPDEKGKRGTAPFGQTPFLEIELDAKLAEARTQHLLRL